MIKVLHYCWFGNNPLPQSAVKYMESWKKFCPDFVIKRWDESNFDVEAVPCVKEAYAAGKWAFVSDYVRAYALYEEGGLYVDTDVEFVKGIYDLLDCSFMGFETPEIVAPGLILYAAEPKQVFFEKILKYYDSLHYSEENKSEITSPKIYTKILEEFGLEKNNTLQHLNEITVYPMEYFQPLGDKRYGIKKRFTENTRAVHHYDASWLNKVEKDFFSYKMKYGNFWGKALFVLRHPISSIKKWKRKQ